MNKITIAILVLGLMGFFFSLLLALLSKKLKVEEAPQTARVLDLLPGLNCGACGFSGCRAYAETAIKECDVFNGCLPAGKPAGDRPLYLAGSCEHGRDGGRQTFGGEAPERALQGAFHLCRAVRKGQLELRDKEKSTQDEHTLKQAQNE